MRWWTNGRDTPKVKLPGLGYGLVREERYQGLVDSGLPSPMAEASFSEQGSWKRSGRLYNRGDPANSPRRPAAKHQ